MYTRLPGSFSNLQEFRYFLHLTKPYNQKPAVYPTQYDWTARVYPPGSYLPFPEVL